MAGGAAGALTRYGLGLLAAALGGKWATWPLMTLLINVSGSFALGLLLAYLGREGSPALRLLLGTGVLGAYTTFSTFSVDLEAMVQRGAYGAAALYLLATVGLGLLAAFWGRLCAEALA